MKDESKLFFGMIRDFLTLYLPRQKAASPNTIKSYRYALNLFIDYVKEQTGAHLKSLSFQNITVKHVEGFLVWLEEKRNNSIASRNQRLACIKAFYKYSARRDVALIAYCQEIADIPKKNEPKGHRIEFFSEAVLQSVLEQPDTSKRRGLRDLVFMILLYDTAARIQEILDIRLDDLHLSKSTPYVVLTGKGNKTRVVPLMDKTASHLKNYLHLFHESSDGGEHLFYVIRKGLRNAMSPDNAAKFIQKYADMAKAINSDAPKRLHPHLFRHSRSMHLYRAGMPLPLLAEWLGHSQMETTVLYYANADTEMKREAIEKATSELNPILDDGFVVSWNDDDELVKKLYGLL